MSEDLYLVVFEDKRPGSNSEDIGGQVISRTGTLQGSDFVVTSASSNQDDPSIAYDTGSQKFLGVWWDRRVLLHHPHPAGGVGGVPILMSASRTSAQGIIQAWTVRTVPLNP